jgi:hypothetical protein
VFLTTKNGQDLLFKQAVPRYLKKIFNTKPERVRSVGRPILRWEDGVNQDRKHKASRTERMPPATETNGHNFLRKPTPTKGC